MGFTLSWITHPTELHSCLNHLASLVQIVSDLYVCAVVAHLRHHLVVEFVLPRTRHFIIVLFLRFRHHPKAMVHQAEVEL